MPSRVKKTVDANSLGLCCVYVCHSRGFHGKLRPAHDTAPTAQGTLTEDQVRELRELIAAKMLKMMHDVGTSHLV